MANKIWKPKLIFKNSYESQVLNYDPKSSDLLLLRNGNSTKAPLSQVDEARVYKPNETHIWWRSRHLKSFKCHFDLYYIPFDNQICNVQVRTVKFGYSVAFGIFCTNLDFFQQLEAADTEQNFSQLTEWGLKLSMKHTLNKFIVTDCSTQIQPNGIHLSIHLQRISGPFWMSLFVPSICLILAAEVSLFIDESHFEALIMVSLTSNLVMYTLYNAIQADLPQASSLKLLDIWLLHGLVMPMVVFLTLVINELVSTKPSYTKVADTKVNHFKGNNYKKEGYEKKRKSCMFLWKCLIPVSSIIFIINFFIVCLLK